MKFTSTKRKRLERLVRILGNGSLEVFGSQVTIAMLRLLKFYRNFCAILKKHGEKFQSTPNSSGVNYGIRVQRNAKEAEKFDKENVSLLWKDAILKELESLMYMKVFKKIP